MLGVDDSNELTEPRAGRPGHTRTVAEVTFASIPVGPATGSGHAANPTDLHIVEAALSTRSLEHDPLCRTSFAEPLEQALDGAWLCQCELIATIRADERAATLREAVAAIEALPCRCDESFDYCDGHTAAIDTIEALGPQA